MQETPGAANAVVKAMLFNMLGHKFVHLPQA